MFKKGQVTLFAILGFLLIIIVFLLLFFLKKNNQPNINELENPNSMEYYVSSCVESAAKKSFDKIKNTLGSNEFHNGVPVIVSGNRILIPDQNGFNSIVAAELPSNFESCLTENDFLSELGYELNGGVISVEVFSPEPLQGQYYSANMYISIISNITVSNKETTFFHERLDESVVFTPIFYLEPVRRYAERQASAGGYFDLDALADLGSEYEFQLRYAGDGYYDVNLSNNVLGWGVLFAVN